MLINADNSMSWNAWKPVKESLDAIEGGDAIKLSWEASDRL